jgi:phenylpropionate dioxygenase-like ring-hydroxylating dioxygenase large terminal subunit
MPNLYQQARMAGLNPNHWYAVERSASLRRGDVKEVTFWGRTIALFRSKDGAVGAIANRCVHRNIKLTLGHVCGSHLVCSYHGWEYDTEGRVAKIPHDLFGRTVPELRAACYPVCERYGVVWIFPGDSERADETPLPAIPELEGPRPWACVDLDFVWGAHFSIILENLLDFTHAYLHRKFRPFVDAVLVRTESSSDRVEAEYHASIGSGRISGLFVNRHSVDTSHITSCFDYPYQRASTDEKIKHWCFLTPIDERTTRMFFSILFDFDSLQIPFISRGMPYFCARFFLGIAKRLMIVPLLDQDRGAVEAEQEAFDRLRDTPFLEFNPVVGMVQEMIVRQWQVCETGSMDVPCRRSSAAHDDGAARGAVRVRRD